MEQERRPADNAPGDSEAASRLIIDCIPGIVLFMTPTGELEFVNRTVTAYFGKSLEDLRHWWTDDTVHADDRSHALDVFTRATASGEPYKFEARFRRYDGTYRWFQCRGVPHRDEAERIVRWYAVGTDIDERKRAEDALRQSEARRATAERDLQLMIDTIPVYVAAYEPDGTRSFVNQTWQEYMGLTVDEATGPNGRKTFPHFHPEDAERIDGAWRASLASGQSLLTEARVRRADGQYRWHTSHRVPLHDEQGKIIRWYSVGVDIDNQKSAEEGLRRSEARLAAAERELQLTIDTIPTLVATYRPDGSRFFVNQTWRDYLGLRPDDAVDAFRTDVVHPEDSERVLEEWQRCLTSELPFSAEMRLRRADGVYRWHTVHRVLSRDESGAVVKWYSVGVDIEEQKRSEERLRRSETRLAAAERELQLTIDTIPTLVATYRPDGSRLFVNQTWLDYTGLPPDSAINVERTDIVHPDDAARTAQEWRNCLATGAPFKAEVRLRRADGEYRWHSVHRLLARDETGAMAKWYSVGVDIEEQKRAEEKLRDSELSLRSVIDGIPGLIGVLAPNGRVEAVNRQIIEYSGRSLKELNGWATNGTVHDDDRSRVAELFERSISAGIPYEIEHRLRRFDGAYLWFNNRGIPVRDDAGQIVCWYVLLTDIDERKRAEERLRESEYSSRLIADTIPGLIIVFSPDGNFEGVNRQTIEYFGKTLDDVASKRWSTRDAIHPEDYPRCTELFKQSIASGDPFEFELRFRRSDGIYRWFQSRGLPLRDANGRIVRWYNLLIDIDERKRAEEALQHSEARLAEAERELRLTLDSIPAMTWRAAPNGYVQSLNKRWFDYTGSTPEQSQHNGWRSFVHPDDQEKLADSGRRNIPAGTPVDVEGRLRRLDGEYRWFMFRVEPMRDEAGEISAWYGTITDIEDRKRAENALQQSQIRLADTERDLRIMLDSIPTVTWRSGANGYVQYLNKKWFEYTGTTSEQVRGWRWKLCVHPDDLDQLVAAGDKYVGSGIPIDSEARLRRFDGEYRWFLFRPAPVRDETGNVVAWYGTITDIEDRKQAEQKALEAEREVQHMLDSIPAMIVRGGTNGYIQYFSKQWFEYTGTTLETARGFRWWESLHPDDKDRLVEFGARFVASAEPGDCEARLRRFDGTYRWFLFRPAAARDEAGNFIGWYGTVTDIEDRKRAEQKALEAEREVQRTIDNIPVLIGTYSAEGKRLSVNKWALEVTGLSAEDMPDERWKKAFHPDEMEAISAQWRECLARGEPFEREVRTRMADGTYRAHVTRRLPLRDEAGKIVRWYGIAHDIEDQRRAETELRRSEAFLAEGQRVSSTGTFSWRFDTNELKFSDELCRIFELDQAAPITAERIFSRVHPEDVPILSERMKLVRSGSVPEDQELRLRMQDGRIKHLRIVGQMMDLDGRSEYLAAAQDITQRRLAEEATNRVRSELAHVTRVMSLGALTASIAHEVNQPLAGIITNASTCLRMLAADPPNVDGARETARRTIRDGNRAADVITRLRALFGKKAAVSETLDLNEATREVVALVFSDLLRNRVIVRVELDDAPLLVTGDRVQLQQVILNLVRNASDAMSDVNDRPRNLLVKAERQQDGSAQLTVRDAGVGLHPQTAERLFDAFYTSKTEGMGIGLSVSRSIIESHGGKIWAETNDGAGATFSFSIPSQATSAGDESTPAAILTRPTRGAHDRTRNA